jgi:hypothetical protein
VNSRPGAVARWPYGTPLLHGLPTGDTLLVLAVALAALASVRFARKDIGR